VLTDTSPEATLEVLARMRTRWATLQPDVTFSCDIAAITDASPALTAVGAADQALYASKAAGRNCDHIHYTQIVRGSLPLPAQLPAFLHRACAQRAPSTPHHRPGGSRLVDRVAVRDPVGEAGWGLLDEREHGVTRSAGVIGAHGVGTDVGLVKAPLSPAGWTQDPSARVGGCADQRLTDLWPVQRHHWSANGRVT
jgi:hypothetical protein